MSGFAQNQIQAAVFVALSNDKGLTALLGNNDVHDWAGLPINFPCVTIGDDTAKDWDGCTFDGQETTLTIHSWSQGEGRKVVKTIMENVYRVLHRSNLVITGQNLVLCLCEFATTSIDPDGTTFHGVQRFRIITQGV